jgi:hypothetical protein
MPNLAAVEHTLQQASHHRQWAAGIDAGREATQKGREEEYYDEEGAKEDEEEDSLPAVREDGLLPAEKAKASWRKRLKMPGDGVATMSDAMVAELAEREEEQITIGSG